MRNNSLPIERFASQRLLQRGLSAPCVGEVRLTAEKNATENFMKQTDENFEKYQRRLEELKGQLVPTPPSLHGEKLMAWLAAEGEKLLTAEQKNAPVTPAIVKDERPKLDATLALSSTNPYVRARVQVLQKMPETKRNEIEKMEKTGNINNRTYEAFVHQVTVLGDNMK